MSQKISLIVIRILGTLGGLVGLSMLWFTQFMWPSGDKGEEWFMVFFGIVGVLMGLYLLYVAYLVWWRFTPLAVRHVCAVLALYLWSLLPKSDAAPASALLFFGSFLVMYIVYRVANFWLSRFLFPEHVPGSRI